MITHAQDGTPVNDDDLYVVDPMKGEIIRRLGPRSMYRNGMPLVQLPIGQTLMYGMQAKHMKPA